MKLAKGSMVAIIAALLAFALVLPCHAQTTTPVAPAFSMQRVLVTAGLDVARYDNPVRPLESDKRWELKPSLNLAYNLGNFVSLTASYSRGLDSDRDEVRGGVRLRLYNGQKR
jgi:hypothetical protein